MKPLGNRLHCGTELELETTIALLVARRNQKEKPPAKIRTRCTRPNGCATANSQHRNTKQR